MLRISLKDLSVIPKLAIGTRRDIQSLRAIAVLGVLCFHTGLPVHSGFLGVDVFFCISGYLISSLLLRKGRLNRKIVRDFVVARSERLIPAYLAVVCFTVVSTTILILPEISVTTLITGLMGISFIANIYIAGVASDYFGAPANNNALLHTWTLSTEWQMYFLIALFYWVASRNTDLLFRRIKHTIFISTLVSLVLWISVYLIPNFEWGHLSRFVSYYGVGTRFWEFGIGSIASFYSLKSSKRINLSVIKFIRGFSWILLILVLLVPTNNVVLILILAIFTTICILVTDEERNSAGLIPVLGSIIQFLGLCSYSIYLWHWPVIVLARLLFPNNIWATPLAALFSLLPAFFSWSLLERDFRRHLKSSKFSYQKILALMLSTILIIQFCLLATNHLKSVNRNSAIEIVKGNINPTYFPKLLAKEYARCSNQKIYENAIKYKGIVACQQTFSDRPIEVAILGDSHAQQLFLAMTLASPETNFTYFSTEAGLPLIGDPQFDRILRFLIQSKSIKTIYLSARWEVRGVPVSELITSIDPLYRNGKKIFIFDDLPTFPTDVTSCKYKARYSQKNICEVDSKYFFKTRAKYLPLLKKLTESIPGSQLVEFPNFVCDNQLCSMAKNGELIFRDSNHLTEYGCALLGKYLLNQKISLVENLSPISY